MSDAASSEAEMLNVLRRFVDLCRGSSTRPGEGAILQEILMEIRNMSDTFATELAQLQADVAAQSTVIASATTAFQGLAAQLASAEAAARSAGATDVQIASIAAVRQGLEANTAALATAIPANTPAAGQAATPTPTPAAPAPSAPSGGDATPSVNTGANPATTTPVSNPGQTTPAAPQS